MITCLKNKIWFLSLAILMISFLSYNDLSSPIPPLISVPPSASRNPPPPRLAYYIYGGSAGDGARLKRLLQAVYHPHNVYMVHLGMAASPTERRVLFDYIDSHPVFSIVRNVEMHAEPDLVMKDGLTKINSVIIPAILLQDIEWDWLVNLDVYDYPLVKPDDLLHVLSRFPRHLNFIDHTVDLSTKQDNGREQSMQISTFLEKYYDLFTGSPWMVLSRSFIEYCMHDWQIPPRSLLLWYNAMKQADSNSDARYFQTLICNSPKFHKTTVNTDFRFTTGDNTSPEHARYISMRDYWPMLRSDAPFARKFDEEHSQDLLDWIDQKLLSRSPDTLVQGGWCAGSQLENISMGDPRLIAGDMTRIRHGSGARRLTGFLAQLVQYNGSVSSPQCAS